MEFVQKGYEIAKEIYAKYGVDVDQVIEQCDAVPLSIHCWQGDDLTGFEKHAGTNGGGIQATGNYPGKATTHAQLFSDLEMALRFIPGNKRVGIHASYLDAEIAPGRDKILPEHFDIWIDWANKNGWGLDFNGTFFAHEMADTGYTLSSANDAVRNYWIEHGKRCREISAYIAARTGKGCCHNIWIPDGEKEVPIDTLSPRLRLTDALDEILSAPMEGVIDSVESKLFGIGSEAYVTGSFEFYLSYVLSRNNAYITMDTGHFHPTETVSSKISAMLPFVKGILLHVSRPIRWDSDHVVAFDDETRALMSELIRCNALPKTCISLDYFDGSVNRVFAWVVGARNARKALLEAMLQPNALLKQIEASGDTSQRLALSQEIRTLPFGLVWDYYCAKSNAGVGIEWTAVVKEYEKQCLAER